ncbi:MAG: MBL fold metallo-hydrolase [Pseudomonadales bacterium]
MNNRVHDGGTRLTFLGAAGTVTGSKYLLEHGGCRILVDAGLFQGKAFGQKNLEPLPFDVGSLDAVFLTHAHLDHSGYLPVLKRAGFTGPVYCTSGTAALAGILLPDSGHLQQEDAAYAARKKFEGGEPREPLYTEDDAREALSLLQPVPFHEAVAVGPGITATFHRAGHILGAAWIRFDLGGTRIVFSGDVGRPDDPVMLPPEALTSGTDYLVTESTYGDRQHSPQSPEAALREVVNATARRNGVLMIPAFAVGRAQAILLLLARLRERGQIPGLPTYLNSPMAIDATDIYCRHADEHRLSDAECAVMCRAATFVNSADESRALNERHGPMIVVSASGMASGGRILHHFRAWLEDDRNTVLFTGYQAGGTRGAAMVAGAKSVFVHGRHLAVNATVTELSSLSAHADATELRDWLATTNSPPRRVFVTHGEPESARALQNTLQGELSWPTDVPELGQSWGLD